MSSPFSFNYKEVDKSEVVEMGSLNEILPQGKYLAIVLDSEIAETKSGGEMLSLTFEIMQGEHKNRKIWHNFNIKNASEKAERIARGELMALCSALDVVVKSSTSELHDKVLCIEVKHKKDTYQGTTTMKARIVGFYPESEYKPEDVTGGSPF